MSSRYNRLFTVNGSYCSKNCPIIIDGAALLKDNVQDKVLVQAKYINISMETVISFTVRIKAMDIANRVIYDEITYQYLDLDIKYGCDYGEKIPIYLDDNTIRSFKIEVKEVVYVSGKIWSDDGEEWELIPNKQFLGEFFEDSQLVEQFSYSTNTKGDFVPVQFGCFWRCTCGSYNNNSEYVCHTCNAKYMNLMQNLDFEILNQAKEIRFEQERIAENKRREEEEHERQIRKQRLDEENQRKRKRNKKIVGIIGIVVALSFIVFFISNAAEFFSLDNRCLRALRHATNKYYNLAERSDPKDIDKYIALDKKLQKFKGGDFEDRKIGALLNMYFVGADYHEKYTETNDYMDFVKGMKNKNKSFLQLGKADYLSFNEKQKEKSAIYDLRYDILSKMVNTSTVSFDETIGQYVCMIQAENYTGYNFYNLNLCVTWNGKYSHEIYKDEVRDYSTWDIVVPLDKELTAGNSVNVVANCNITSWTTDEAKKEKKKWDGMNKESFQFLNLEETTITAIPNPYVTHKLKIKNNTPYVLSLEVVVEYLDKDGNIVETYTSSFSDGFVSDVIESGAIGYSHLQIDGLDYPSVTTMRLSRINYYNQVLSMDGVVDYGNTYVYDISKWIKNAKERKQN